MESVHVYLFNINFHFFIHLWLGCPDNYQNLVLLQNTPKIGKGIINLSKNDRYNK